MRQEPASSSGETSDDPRTPFERFRDLTRHILDTPKAELMKHVPKAKPTTKKRAKKK